MAPEIPGEDALEALVDAHVATRIRSRRAMVGLSQAGLAHAAGLNLRQLRRYERAAGSIPVGKLARIAKALNVPVRHFLDGIDGGDPRPPSSRGVVLAGMGHHGRAPDQGTLPG